MDAAVPGAILCLEVKGQKRFISSPSRTAAPRTSPDGAYLRLLHLEPENSGFINWGLC